MKASSSRARVLPCLRCGQAYTVAELLALCEVSWPNQRWLGAVCKACNYRYHLEVSNGRVAVGDLDGGPGPCFFAKYSVAAPGFRVKPSMAGVRVRLGRLSKLVPAKR